MLANPGDTCGWKVSKKGLRNPQAKQNRAGVAYTNHWLTTDAPASVPSVHENT